MKYHDALTVTDIANVPVLSPSPGFDAGGELNRLAARLGEMAKQVDAEDLTGLAQLHDALGGASTLADAALEPKRANAVNAIAIAGMQLIEQIVLKEVDDTRASIAQIGKSIAELQSFVSGVAKVEGAADARPATQIPAQASAALLEQGPLGEADLPLVQEFIGEAGGHLEAAEAGLLQLEEDGSNPDALSAVFRGFHTIKGVAGFLNLVQIGALAHAAESVLDLAQREAAV